MKSSLTYKLCSCVNLNQIDSYDLAEVQVFPLTFLEELVRGNRETAVYRVNGELTILLNNAPDIKRALQSENRYFIKEGTPEMYILKPILGGGMLTSDGEDWVKQRTSANPFFTRENVASFLGIMEEETRTHISRWKDGDEIDLESEMSQLTLQIVGRALFGNGLNDSSASFGECVKLVNEYMGHFDPYDIGKRMDFNEALDQLREIVLVLVAKRRKSKEICHDLLDVLLKMQADEGGGSIQENELIDQIFTFLMAGHETTAKALTWTFYELSKDPRCLQLVEAEVDAVMKGNAPDLGMLHHLSYCWMAVQEGMRLNPPVWVISRKAARDDQFGSIPIPKGTTVLVSPYLIHRHGAYWNNPTQFRPERFSGEEEANRPDYAFIPFSAGPRRCIGMNFANQEMVTVLAMIAQRFRLELKEGFVVEPEALVTLRPKYGMHMIVKQRGPTHV